MTAKNNPQIRWEELNRQIIEATDIESIYKEMGVDLTGSRPNSSGWLQCRAIDRDDKTPSAAICVSTGPQRGRYRDLGGNGDSLSLFDFAAKYGGFKDWEEARREFGKRAGLLSKFPKKDQERPEDKVALIESWNRLMIRGMLQAFPGITEESILLCGGKLARYPAKSTSPRYVVAWAAYGVGGIDGDVRGFVVQPADGGKLEIFKGPGNPTELVKRATIGNSGLVGRHALKNWESAELIWKVEGISDLLSLQSAIPTELRDKHVVVTNAGGTHERYLTSEIAPMFAGKRVAICHDCDVPGQQGAGNWIGSLKSISESIKNVVLPFETTETKGKDLRDWLVSGGSYSALLEMYDAAEELAVKPDHSESNSTTIEKPKANPQKDQNSTESKKTDPTESVSSIASEFASLTTEQQCLKKLGIVVLGEVEGTKTIVCFAQKLAKMVEIKYVEKYKVENFAQDFGEEAFKQWIEIGDGKPDPNKYTMTHVKMAIAIEGGKRRLTSQNQLGVGVWELNGRLVFVNSGELAILNGHLERSIIPSIEGKLIDFGSGEPWYDYDELQDFYHKTEDPKYCLSVFDEAINLFARWDNWAVPDTPPLVASLVCCTWLQTVWKWRPQIAICGPTNCGKSMLFEETLKYIFGGLCLLSSRPTEAGVRQGVGHTAKIVLIDEFEHDQHREKIMELFRTSSRGSETLRGTAGAQKGIKFGMKHIPWMSAIEIGTKRAPDRNRYILLELRKVVGNASTLVVPKPEELRLIGIKLLSVAMRYWRKVVNLSAELKQRSFAGIDRRVVESHCLPYGMLGAVLGMDTEATFSLMESAFANRDTSEQSESDEATLLQEIYESLVYLPRGETATVSEMLSTNFVEPGWQDAMMRSGIKPFEDSAGDRRIFFVKHSMRKTVLKNSDFAGQDINQILIRIHGARRDKQRMGGHNPRGISIAEKQIHELLDGPATIPKSTTQISEI